MSFSLRAVLANIGFTALFLGAWVTTSGLYIAIATVVFLVLILLSVVHATLDRRRRPYWIGNAVVACGILLFSHHLPILDTLAYMDNERRIANRTLWTPLAPPSTYVPGSVTAPPQPYNGTQTASIPTYYPSGGSSSTIPMSVTLVAAPTRSWSFSPITDVDGYTNLLRAFLVCSAAYFIGVAGGLICARMYAQVAVENTKQELQLDPLELPPG